MNDLRKAMNQLPELDLCLLDLIHDLAEVIRRVQEVEDDVRAPFFYVPRDTFIAFVTTIDRIGERECVSRAFIPELAVEKGVDHG